MVVINPDKTSLNLHSRFNQPWVKLHDFSSTIEIIQLGFNAPINVDGFIEIECRAFNKNGVFSGSLFNSYERIYRLQNDNKYLYKMVNETGLIHQLWGRFRSKTAYATDINVNVLSVELLGDDLAGNKDEMISILKIDDNWFFNGAGSTFLAPLVSRKTGDNVVGAVELGYFNPLPIHKKIYIPLNGGLSETNTTFRQKRVKALDENDVILFDYSVLDLIATPRPNQYLNIDSYPLVNDAHTPYRYSFPCPNKRFKLRFEDNDSAWGWAWFGVYPEGIILSA